MTADPASSSGDPSDPQSWNRYAYTHGDPINLNDPSGLNPDGDEEGGGGQSPCANNPTGIGCLPPTAPGPEGNRQPTPLPPQCDPSNPVNAKFLDFIDSNRDDAQKLAQQLSVSVQDILAVAAEESAFGDTTISNLAANNNFFGLHNGSSPFPGQTGTYYTHPIKGRPVATPTFSDATGFYDSGEVFVNLEKPWLSQAANPSDPTTFATIIGQHGYGPRNGDAGFVKMMKGVINGFRIRLNCPPQ